MLWASESLLPDGRNGTQRMLQSEIPFVEVTTTRLLHEVSGMS
jgi:hypothetical protein